MPEFPVNSQEWWDDYFQRHWDAFGGGSQTRHFMQRLVANLPQRELTWLASATRTILDWGCALGEGVFVLAERMPHCIVSGLDWSATAIEEARRRHPNCDFDCSPNGEIRSRSDVLITSNCLEHFDDPVGTIRSQLHCVRYLYIALTPYDEWPLHSTHRIRLTEESFPDRIEDFRLLHTAKVEVEPLYWPGSQLLVIYGSAEYGHDAPR